MARPVDLSVYVLVDPSQAAGRNLAELARDAAIGGATLVQYRDKEADTRTMVERARMIVAGLADTGVPLLVNDRVDVALAAGAQGVHVGQSDMQPADVRRLMGSRAIIGLTIQSAAQVAEAPIAHLDYVCIGGVFATASKQKVDAPLGLDGFSTLARAMRARAPGLPVGAIAGIDASNAADVIRAGADGVAVMSAVTRAADPRAAAAAITKAVEAARS